MIFRIIFMLFCIGHLCGQEYTYQDLIQDRFEPRANDLIKELCFATAKTHRGELKEWQIRIKDSVNQRLKTHRIIHVYKHTPESVVYVDAYRLLTPHEYMSNLLSIIKNGNRIFDPHKNFVDKEIYLKNFINLQKTSLQVLESWDALSSGMTLKNIHENETDTDIEIFTSSMSGVNLDKSEIIKTYFKNKEKK